MGMRDRNAQLICAILFDPRFAIATAWLSAAHLFEIEQRLAMPQARVKHSALALRSLAEESAKDCENALRRKAGEGTNCVVCEYAAFSKSPCNALCVFKCCFRYIGVRAADGTLERQADAMTLSKLVFRWSVRRGGGESLHECEVRCDNALKWVVPHPEMSYCTRAELECIAMSAASSHEATLRQQDGQNNVGVVCRCAPAR